MICLFVLVRIDDDDDRKSMRVLNELENIDDECDHLGVTFVKIDNSDEAREYGIEKLPALVYFEKGIPLMYTGKYMVMRAKFYTRNSWKTWKMVCRSCTHDILTEHAFSYYHHQVIWKKKRKSWRGLSISYKVTKLRT